MHRETRCVVRVHAQVVCTCMHERMSYSNLQVTVAKYFVVSVTMYVAISPTTHLLHPRLIQKWNIIHLLMLMYGSQ